jgi:anti-sigma regulatory factor (Ser/Thr protein kinase)
MNHTESSYSLRLSAQISEIRNIEDFLNSISIISQLGQEKVQTLLLCIIEAYTNAVLHGNTYNPNQVIDILIEVLDDNTLSISIINEGPTFSLEKAKEKAKVSKEGNEGGRGILLMDYFSDTLQVFSDNKKTTVTMTFSILLSS